MKKTDEFDIRFLIIGTGPAGNAVAIRLAQLGAKGISIIERGPIGGICVNRGCIPIHAMLHFLKFREYFSEIKQRNRLFNKLPEIDFHALASTRKKLIENFQSNIRENYERNGIELIEGTARVIDPHRVEIKRPDENKTFKSVETFIVASGVTFTVFDVSGVENTKELLIGADQVMAMELDRIPKSIAIWGFDSPAVELACFYHLLGSGVVLLCPLESVVSYGSEQLGITVEEMLESHDIEIRRNVELKSFVKAAKEDKLVVEFSDDPKENNRFECDFFVNAFNRQTNLECVQGVRIEMEGDRPHISEAFQSSIQNIFFVGDIRSGNRIPYRSHLAAYSGRVLAELLMGQTMDDKVDLKLLPVGMATIDFEIAKIGLSEQEAIGEGLKVKVLQVPNSHNAFAYIIGKRVGYVSVIIEATSGKILGGEIIGQDAINLITIIGTAIACNGTIYDLKRLPAFHPSLAEGIFDSAWEVK